MLADESVVVELLMTASQFLSEAQKAAKATGDIGKAGQQASKEASSGFDRMRQSAKENSAEWNTVGGHLLKVGAAQVAFGTAVAVTGGNYNRLQQTSRAALSSMLGGARAANQQMDKLDAWATSSPFSRAVWIEAQQQLLAFGVEANRVVPYMDAIQNAVAAAGGSEVHLRGITEIMAKISSSSKITGQDLMAFGNWGVNAAELIGLAMGKTGAQIREEITAGTLNANVALDALAIGMSTKFAGAAANVKNTFDGAFDRVKATFRDVSAEIMQPFIGQQGGGLFTSWLNGAADLLRAFQRLPGPVKDFTAAFGLASTTLTMGGGAFLTLVPRVLELHRSLTVLGSQGIPIISRFASSWASVPGHLSTSFSMLQSGFRSVGDSMTLASQMGVSKAQAMRVGVGSAFSAMQASAKSAGSALLGAFGGPVGLAATAAITGVTMAVMNYSRKQQEANAFAKQFAGTLDDVTGAGTRASKELVLDEMFDRAGASAWEASGYMHEWVDAMARMDVSTLERIAEEQNRIADGTFVWSDAARVAGDMDHMLQGVKTSMENTAASTSVMGEVTDEMKGSVEGAAGGLDNLADSAEAAAEAQEHYLDILKGVIDLERQRADNYASLEAAQDKQLETLAKLTSQLEENGQTLDQNTEAGRNNRAYLRDLQDGYHSVIDSMIAMTDEQGNATYSAQQMGEETQRMRDEFIETAMQFGANADEAAAMADAYGLVPESVKTRAEFDNATAKAELRATLDEYTEIPEEVRTLLTAFGDDAIAVATLVAEAIEVGVPTEKLVKLLADGSDAVTTSQEVQSAIDSVKQERAAAIEAMNWATPEVQAAQRGVDSVKQKRPAPIEATDKATGVSRTAQSSIDSVRQRRQPTISVIDSASGTVRAVQGNVNSLQGKTITITTRHVQVGRVNSGMSASVYAYGGPVFGPGGPRDDLIPAFLSNNEHVMQAMEVAALGGHQNVLAMRQMIRSNPWAVRDALGFAEGGSPATGPASSPTHFLQRTSSPYVAHSRTQSAQKVVNVNVNSHDIINYPVAEPDSVRKAKDAQLVASLAGGLG